MIQKKLIEPKIKLEDAIKLVEASGYIVIKDDTINNSIPNKELVDLFYSNLKTKLPTESVFYYQANEKNDLTAINKFHVKAKSLGIKKGEANTLLKEAIIYLFANMEELNLTDYPKSISFLLSNAGSWIFKKCLDLSRQKIIMFEDSDEAKEYLTSVYEAEDEAYRELKDKKTKQLLGDDNG